MCRRVQSSAATSAAGVGVLWLLLVALTLPSPVSAYHFFQLKSGTTYVPVKWGTIGIRFWVDTEAGFLAEVQAALDTWNNVTTAQNVFGAPYLNPVNMTGANYDAEWGSLTGDGLYEVVLDSDGTGLAALGLDPASINGYGPSRRELIGGQGRITDAYLIINGTRTDFDRRSTEVHELGHILGLAHSPVGMHNSGEFPSDALDVVNVGSVPTMHPFSVGGTARRTLEADDLAGFSQLYPEASFATTFGTISGTVTRCGGTDAVLGVSVRAVSTSNSAIQVARYSGFDGNTTGYFEIKGLPPGSYRVVVESLGANDVTPDRMALVTRADDDFATEYYDPPKEKDCTEELPDTAVAQAVTANATTQNINFKVGGVNLAFVVDDTGSMSNEIASVRKILSRTITLIQMIRAAFGKPFPAIAVVTFKDNVTRRVISNDPARLQAVVAALGASGGGDCPESANAALLAAGRLLSKNGKAMLFTDADSRADGPDRGSVETLYNSKSLKLSTLLSGTCSGTLTESRDPVVNGGMDPAFSSNARDEYPRPKQLGPESAIRTFAEISAETEGFFTAIPGIKTSSATEHTRYENTGTSIAVSSETPTVGLVSPGDGPRGTTLMVEISGLDTNFVSTSTVAFSGSGVTVNWRTVFTPTRLIANISIAASATTGFRDVTVTSSLGGGAIETATGTGAFNIVNAPTAATIVGVSPWQGAQGTRFNVTISGASTHFAQGSSKADFGSGVTVHALTVTSATSAVADVSVASNAAIGYRDVKVTTGSETARESVTGPFLVVAPPSARARVVSIAPAQAARGQSVDVTITGENTTWINGSSVVSLSGLGVTVISTSVQSLTRITASVLLDTGADLGFRDVIVTTGSEVATLLSGFRVTDGGTSHSNTLSYLAEGATGPFFDMRIALLNPQATPADVQLQFLRGDGVVISWSLSLPPRTRRSLDPETIPGLEKAEFSTVVESSVPIVVDRTMTWDRDGYGSHAESSIGAPSPTWYLAEGATHSGFDLFYLIQNPNPVTATIEVRYLLPAPKLPVVKTYQVRALSRFNIWVDAEDPALADTDVSAVLTSLNGQPIIVERAMYLSLHGRMFEAGHESAGVTAPATNWFLAEGATGPYFDLFILIANPGESDASVEARYLLPGGRVITKTYTVRANSRFNIWVDMEGAALADTAVSTTVTSTNGVPVIVERALWWPYGYPNWTEAHNSSGATTTGTLWAVADGESGGSRAFETYVLIANTSAFSGSAKVDLVFEDGTSLSKTFALEANSRTNVAMSAHFPEANGRKYGTIVESLGAPAAQVVVERAMYSNALGGAWMAGSNAVATRLR